MDEREKNPLTISDILEQLVKPSVVQSGAQPLQPKQVVPTSSAPPSKQPDGSISLPQLNKPGPQEPALKSPSEITGRPPDRRPMIRTMRDDLARLKQGLSPLGLELVAKKSVDIKAEQTREQVKKTVSTPPEVLNKSTLPPISSRPIAPVERPAPPKIQPQFLGQKPVVPPTTLPPLQTNTPAHFHEEIKILDKDNLPAFLGAPVPKKKAPKPEEEKVEYGVIAKIIGSGMTTGIISTIVLAMISYGLIYYFFFREEAIVTTTITPTPAITSTVAEINELEAIFRTIPITNFSFLSDSDRLVPEFHSFLNKEVLAQKEFKRIKFLPSQPSDLLTLTTLFDKLAIKYPAELSSRTKNNNIIFLYGQMENFNSPSNTNKRVVFIVEVGDPAKVNETMKNWEKTMAENLKNFFDIDPSKEASVPFLSNEYRTTKIQYKNFPLPDKTIDYAIVSSLTGRYYLILTNSRESIYSPIDKIKGI